MSRINHHRKASGRAGILPAVLGFQPRADVFGKMPNTAAKMATLPISNRP